MATQIALPEIDAVQITVITDNTVDLLMGGSDVAHRFPLASHQFDGRPLPVAEHGFSVLLRVRQGDRTGVVLFDTGVSPRGLTWNMDVLEIPIADIQAVVLSHGHPDHALGFPSLIIRLGARNIPLVIHPDAYLERKLVLPDGFEVFLPAPRFRDFRDEGIEVIEEVGPSMLIDGMVLVSGEVERTTEFEQGFKLHHAHREDGWGPDPLILDDQCVILNLAGKGLVVISGCGHSGIVNIVRHAQRLTGIDRVHAVLGGFHLTGPLFEPIIPATIAALLDFKPRWVMPGHCTGWRATHGIARAMPEAFIANSVGTTVTF
jgi:7,8-dihydropterin-6-yl-methyl-4-(beta-D-ribofuranosyl)aminobenzene 5'-phosphate synthase